ncbi:MAG: TonB-dependent receptor, partial [Asticcacaulis sp.]|nr:TonB-dependent receptor [Asticcacaulis sp.]
MTTIDGALDVHIYDVERIESLAGPQGTLYGASSEAGTIRIITNKPDMSGFYGRVDVEGNAVAHGDEGGKLEGMINMPLGDRAALRVVGWTEHDGGYIDNVYGTRSFLPDPGGITVNNKDLVKKNFNDVSLSGARAALKVDLNEDWTATASVMGQTQKAHGSFGFDTSLGDLEVQHFYPDWRKDRFAQAALTVQGKIGNFDLTYAGAHMDRRVDAFNDYTDYAESYDAAYSDYGGLAGYFYFYDANGDTIDPRQYIVGQDHFTKDSHELRLSSPSDQRLRFVGGLFYEKQDHRILQDYIVPGLAPAMSVNGRPGTLWLTLQDREDVDSAVFGEMSYDLTEQLTATVGVRAFKYDNSLIGFFGFGRNPDGPPWNGAGSSKTGVAGCYTT